MYSLEQHPLSLCGYKSSFKLIIWQYIIFSDNISKKLFFKKFLGNIIKVCLFRNGLFTSCHANNIVPLIITVVHDIKV